MTASIRLARTTQGHGTPVIAIHSSGMGARQWLRLAAHLAPDHQVILPDLLGYGGNPPWGHKDPFTLRAELDALRRLLDEVDGPAHLVGHSYGGLLALLLALEMSVRSVCLYEPVAFGVLHATGDREGLAGLASLEHNPLFLDEERGGSEAWLELFINYWNGPGAWRGLPDVTRAGFLKVGRKAFLEVRGLIHHPLPVESLATLQVPTLLMRGAASPRAAQRVVACLGRLVPNARVVTLEGAGHMGPLTHMEQVNALIAAHVTP